MSKVSKPITNTGGVSGPINKRLLVIYTIVFVIGLKGFLIGYFLLNIEILPNMLNRTTVFTLKVPERNSRILIFAPHPDDEMVGCSALIKKAAQNGCKLKVVMITNGDGVGVLDEVKYIFGKPKPEEFIKTGYLRQAETKRALALLGVPENDIIFLGYPDRGSVNLWRDNWDADKPYTSLSTKLNHSVYHNSYTPGVSYTGSNLINDIEKIIGQFNPTHIVYPHFYDSHVDHFSTNNFVKYAIAKLDLNVKEITYLVHRGNWPVPPVKSSHLYLFPPKALNNCGIDWYSLNLSNDNIIEKDKCLRIYKSQMDKFLMRGYLLSFIRKNELFGEYDNFEVANGREKTYPVREVVINFRNPFADLLVSYLNKPADIYSLTLGFNNSIRNKFINCKIKTLEKPGKQYEYLLDLIFFYDDESPKRAILGVENGELSLKKLTADSIELPNQAACTVGQDHIKIHLPLEDHDGLRAICINAVTYKNGTRIDRTGMRLIKIKKYF